MWELVCGCSEIYSLGWGDQEGTSTTKQKQMDFPIQKHIRSKSWQSSFKAYGTTKSTQQPRVAMAKQR